MLLNHWTVSYFFWHCFIVKFLLLKKWLIRIILCWGRAIFTLEIDFEFFKIYFFAYFMPKSWLFFLKWISEIFSMTINCRGHEGTRIIYRLLFIQENKATRIKILSKQFLRFIPLKFRLFGLHFNNIWDIIAVIMRLTSDSILCSNVSSYLIDINLSRPVDLWQKKVCPVRVQDWMVYVWWLWKFLVWVCSLKTWHYWWNLFFI